MLAVGAQKLLTRPAFAAFESQNGFLLQKLRTHVYEQGTLAPKLFILTRSPPNSRPGLPYETVLETLFPKTLINHFKFKILDM